MQPRYAKWEDGQRRINPWVEYWQRVQDVPLWAKLLALAATPMAYEINHIFEGMGASGIFRTAPGLIFFLLATQPWRQVVAPTRPTIEDVSELLSQPSKIPAYPVELEIFQNGVVTGGDYGVITFVDAWLVFHGLDCTFSIRRIDLAPAQEVKSLALAQLLLAEEKTRFPVIEPSNTQSISFSDRKVPGHSTNQSFEDAFGFWIGRSTPPGSPVFPPRDLHPMTRFKRWNYFWGPFILILMACFWDAPTLFGHDTRVSWIVVACFAAMALVAGSVRAVYYGSVLSRVTRKLKVSEKQSAGPLTRVEETQQPAANEGAGTVLQGKDSVSSVSSQQVL